MHAGALPILITCFALFAAPGVYAQVDSVEVDSSRGAVPSRARAMKVVPGYVRSVPEAPWVMNAALDSLVREYPHLRKAILRQLCVTSWTMDRSWLQHESIMQALRDYSRQTQFEQISARATRHQELFEHAYTYGLMGQLSVTGFIDCIIQALK